MGININEIKDPKLKAKILAQLNDKPVRTPTAMFGISEWPTDKRIRQDSKPLMNKLEAEFYEILKGEYKESDVFVQAIRFRLGNGIWYKPDFVISMTSAYEVKGPHAFRGGFENLKVAASLYKGIQWKLVWKEGGRWKVQVVFS